VKFLAEVKHQRIGSEQMGNVGFYYDIARKVEFESDIKSACLEIQWPF
jgi:hypothetical protein